MKMLCCRSSNCCQSLKKKMLRETPESVYISLVIDIDTCFFLSACSWVVYRDTREVAAICIPSQDKNRCFFAAVFKIWWHDWQLRCTSSSCCEADLQSLPVTAQCVDDSVLTWRPELLKLPHCKKWLADLSFFGEIMLLACNPVPTNFVWHLSQPERQPPHWV